MSRVWKLGLLALVITSIVWLTTLWRWQITARDVGQQDIVMHLLVLPLALMLTLWLAIRLGGQVRRQLQEPAVKPVAMGKALDLAAQASPAVDPVQSWDVVLLGSEVCLMPGDQAPEVAQQVRDRQVWPRLDASLTDFNGLPVFTARVPVLDHEATHGACPEHSMRAWRLMARVWQPLAERILETRWQPGWRAGDQHQASSEHSARPAHLAGVGRERSHLREAVKPRMTVAVVLPGHTPQAWQDRCLAQVQSMWAGQLDEEAATVPWQMDWVAWVEPSAQTLWARIDQAFRDWSSLAGLTHGPARSLVVLVADSAVAESCIEQWQGRGELFTAQHQLGRVPGEGAVALWWCRTDWPSAGAEGLPLVRVMSPVARSRDRSADVLGRVGHEVLQACISDAMSAMDLKTDWQVFSDADHRASRTSELYEALTEVAPDLDPMQAVYRLGDVCGDLGLCAGLAPLALAEGVIRDRLLSGNTSPESTTAALVLSVSSPIHRMAVVLAPEPVKQL
jgi:hypothetical protein